MSFDGRKPQVDPAAPIRAKLQRKRRSFVASREAMTKSELRNMLADAVRNTASIAGY